MVKGYVEVGEQLVVEFYVRNIKESCEFYRQFGFEVARDAGGFVELKWENTLLFLEEIKKAPLPPQDPASVVMPFATAATWPLSRLCPPMRPAT
jgi:catechol 2,3-dioxygenase-like lactoylglutathione lyase family enzyme